MLEESLLSLEAPGEDERQKKMEPQGKLSLGLSILAGLLTRKAYF